MRFTSAVDYLCDVVLHVKASFDDALTPEQLEALELGREFTLRYKQFVHAIPWHKAPEFARYFFIQADGNAYWCNNAPELRAQMLVWNVLASSDIQHAGRFVFPDHFDWRDALWERDENMCWINTGWRYPKDE